MGGDKQVNRLRTMGVRKGFTDIEKILWFLIEIGGRIMKRYFSVKVIDLEIQRCIY